MMDPRDKRPRANDFIMNGNDTHTSLRVQNGYNASDHQVRYAFLNSQSGKTATVLSTREMEVLRLIAFGHSTKKVAEKLFLSAHTITNHRKNMLSRSRCGNIAELVRIAIMENLL